MKYLYIDDIKIVGESFKETLISLDSFAKDDVVFYHYDISISKEKNIIAINACLSNNNIEVLVLDRGFSKIYEDQKDFVFSSIDIKDRKLKVKVEEILLDNGGIIDCLSETSVLKKIIILTYNKGEENINSELSYIKNNVEEKLEEKLQNKIHVSIFETSSSYNKPIDASIYIDSFYISSFYKDNFINYETSQRNIGTIEAFKEYGKLLAYIVKDLVSDSTSDLYNFSHKGNREFDEYIRSFYKIQLKPIEEKIEYFSNKKNDPVKDIKNQLYNFPDIQLGSVSAIFNFESKERYYIDFPYKEYYNDLNHSITKEQLSLFKKDDKYLSNQYIYFSYNYNFNERKYELYKLESSIVYNDEIIKTWLPLLHCGLFHYNNEILWKNANVDVVEKEVGASSINMFFFIDTISIGGTTGHINYSFYNESNVDFNDKISLISNRISETYSPILKAKATDSLIPELRLLVNAQATRAAISQVMARNTSHNIGAHVMNKLTDASFLQNFSSEKSSLKSYQPSNDFDDPKEHLSYHQIAIFNNYVKCRMDYLADISFGTPLMQTNKYASDLFKELDKVRLLLEHISGLSDFKYKINFQKNGFDVDNNNDILVAIPNDILGTQAFYNIIENVIRNTAKHASIKPEITTFTVNFIDELNVETDKLEDAQKKLIADQQDILNNFIVVEIFDNIPIEGELLGLTKEEKEEFEKHNVDFNNERINEIVFKQNFKINADILDQNKLRSSSLGVVEMDASAAYLRKRDVGKINDSKYDIFYDESWRNADKYKYFLKAFKKVIQNENKPESKSYSLGYRFFLLRPAVVLVVTDIIPNNIDELKKQGIWIVSPKDFKTHLEEGKVYNHEFVVYATDDNISTNEEEAKIDLKTLTEEHKTSLPIRILDIEQHQLEDLFKPEAEYEKGNKKEILDIWEEFCWEEWDKKFIGNNTIDIGNSFNKRACIQAVFLDHLYGESTTNDGEKLWKDLTNKGEFHLEALSSYAQEKMPDFYKLTKDIKETSTKPFQKYIGSINENKITKRKIEEVVLSKIIVIDERIQEVTKLPEKGGREFMGISYKDLYKRMGVVIPDKETEINLSNNAYNKGLITKIKVYLGLKLDKDEGNQENISCVLENAKSIDFILIHYSIFERMFKKEEINEKIEEVAAKGINVVITSGRGIPDDLTSKVRFVNLSSVISTFIDVRCKYTINYLLNSSRKSNKI